jgi:hypothetical protein
MKWQRYPNLASRPARPALNNGPVQRRARRALLALGEASTSEVSLWVHRLPTPARTGYTRRVLLRMAERVGRAPTIGRPWLWRLRDSEGRPNEG